MKKNAEKAKFEYGFFIKVSEKGLEIQREPQRVDLEDQKLFRKNYDQIIKFLRQVPYHLCRCEFSKKCDYKNVLDGKEKSIQQKEVQSRGQKFAVTCSCKGGADCSIKAELKIENESNPTLIIHLYWNFDKDNRNPPQILFQITNQLKYWRNKTELSYWYYSNVQKTYQINLNTYFQKFIRYYLEALRLHYKENAEITFTELLSKITSLGCKELGKGTNSSLKNHFRAILEVTHCLGMIRFLPISNNEKNSIYCKDDLEFEILDTPQPHVLIAKIFGLKTSIPGFDDLLGGGLLLHSSSDSLSMKAGILGVIWGRYGLGKSTLCAQLAFEMARKGGVGILLVLEQSVQEVLGQAYHFGWLPEDETFDLIYDPYNEEDRLDFDTYSSNNEFVEKLKNVNECNKGLLYIHVLRDQTFHNFHYWLKDMITLLGSGKIPIRFINMDPVDVVQLSPKELNHPGQTQLIRKSTQQILAEATHKGITIWLTTSYNPQQDKDSPYSFLPNIADVSIQIKNLEGGHLRGHSDNPINVEPLRVIELEKVRIQKFARGVHPFEINSEYGFQIFPSGETVSRFVMRVDNTPVAHSIDQKTQEYYPISIGHAAINLALGTGGVRPESVTTLMGPTGCAKTELALLYLLQGKCKTDGDIGCTDKQDRSLFISFRDSWESLLEILSGPLGIQLSISIHDLRMQPADNKNQCKKLINKFKKEFESHKNISTVLIVTLDINITKEWTIAGFNGKDEFVEVIINNVKDKLAMELIKKNPNKNSIFELASSYLGRANVYAKRSKEEIKEVAKKYMDLLELEVGNRTSAWVFQQIKNQFKSLPAGVRYSKVVVDNVAYMDLTTPLIRTDEFFVSNLLAILKKERVTPLFITSLVQGATDDSKMQTQIRDAAHNLIRLKRNKYAKHDFIAMEILKSQQLIHQPSPLEIVIGVDNKKVSEGWRKLLSFSNSAKKNTNVMVSFLKLFCTKNNKLGKDSLMEIVRNVSGRYPSLGSESNAEKLRNVVLKLLNSSLNIEDFEIKENPILRAQLARFFYEAYVLFCDEQEVGRMFHPSRIANSEKIWQKNYRDITDAIELEEGISVRSHSLDDYDNPMGDSKLELTNLELTAKKTVKRKKPINKNEAMK